MNSNDCIRVVVVIPKYGLIGGAESFAFNLTERLAQRDGFDVHVIANQWRQGDAPITFHKVPIIRFPRWLQPISFAYFVQKRIQGGSYDIVHSHDRIFEMDLFTFHGIPHKTWIQHTKRDRLSLFDRATAWVEKKAFVNQKGPVILPVSNLAKEEILKIYNVPDDRMLVTHPGVSVDRFTALSREACRQEIRQRHDLSLNEVVVLFVSMNFELKRLDLVLKGIAAVENREKEKTNFKLLVVGKGDMKRFGGLAGDLGISDRVVFTGVIREVEKYYMAADIFIMPSRFDTFGLVVLEAMAAGLPVIISHNVGARDLVEPGINGFVLSEDPSSSEIATSLFSLLEPGKRKLMGENGRKVARLHSWDKVTEKVANIYQMFGNSTDCSI